MVSGTLVLLIARVLVVVLGFFQFLAMAYFFGVSASTDAYIVAHSVPILFGGIAEGVLNYTFLPVFMEYRANKGNEEAHVISNTVFFFSLVLLVVLALAVLALAHVLVTGLAPGFSDSTQRLAGRLLMIMTPLILLRFLSAFLATLFHSLNRFLLPAVTAALPITGGIIFLVLGARTLGIASLPLGYVAGTLVQFVVLFIGIHRYDIRIGRRVDLGHPGVKQVGRLFGPRLADFSLNGLNLLIDRWFASLLGPGFVSALTFAQKILRIPNMMVMGSLGRTILPVLTDQRSRGEDAEAGRLLSKSIRLMGFAAIPVTLFLMFFRTEIIGLLFQRGAFDLESTRITAYALLFYAFGIVAYSVRPILQVAFFSIQDTLTPLKVSAVFVAVNTVLDYSLMQVFGHGGIALTTSIVMTAGAVVLWVLLQKRIGGLAVGEIVTSLGRVLVVSVVIALGLRLLSSSALAVTDVQVWSYIKMGALVAIGGAVFLGACKVLRISEWREVLTMLKRERGRPDGTLPEAGLDMT
jgi:putative peptidoglycan lipid II flippase